jgi:hypothetical protein
VAAVAVRADRTHLKLSQLFRGYIMPLVTFEAHYVYPVSFECDVRRCGAYVFIVGMSGTQAVTTDTRNIFTEVGFAYLLFDKTNVAHIAGGIRAERVHRRLGINLRALSGRRTA